VGRILVDHARGAGHQEDRVLDRQPGPARRREQPQRAQRGRPGQAGGGHGPAAVHPVDQGPRRERAENPGELLGGQQPGDAERAAGQRDGQQRARDLGHPVPEAGDRGRAREPAERGSVEAGPAERGSVEAGPAERGSVEAAPAERGPVEAAAGEGAVRHGRRCSGLPQGQGQ
jgi:hypothetical protein